MKYVFIILFSFLSSISYSQLSSGSEHNINIYSDSVSVYFFLSDECVICKDYAPYINELHRTYTSDSVRFIGVFPNFASKKVNIEKYKQEYDIQFETRTDYFKKLVSKFHVSVTPEVVIIDEKKSEILYQGRIDNKYYGIGKRRRVITKHELNDALASIANQQKIIEPATKAIGCFINQVDKIIN